jgi:hypothetical protein
MKPIARAADEGVVKLRLLVIVLAGTVLAPAVLFAPSWMDRRNNPHIEVSERFLDFQSVPVNRRAEQLLTVRNDGRTAIVQRSGSGTLSNYAVVCPPSLGVHRRMLDCGFSTGPPSDPACDVLNPGASCAVAFSFTPRTAGRYEARYCFEFASRSQSWRRTAKCLSVTGRGGKSASAR